MFVLYSYIQYEGRTFHGIFETKALAEKAKKHMKINWEYDTQTYIIEKVDINTVFAEDFDSYCIKWFIQ